MNSMIQVIDLSMCLLSDGDASKWPVVGSAFVAGPADKLLRDCSKAVNQSAEMRIKLGGGPLVFRNMPTGFALYTKTRPTGQKDRFVYGHPCGKYFRSYATFLPHLISIVVGDVHNCQCHHCPAWHARLQAQYRATLPALPPPGPLTSRGTYVNAGAEENPWRLATAEFPTQESIRAALAAEGVESLEELEELRAEREEERAWREYRDRVEDMELLDPVLRYMEGGETIMQSIEVDVKEESEWEG